MKKDLIITSTPTGKSHFYDLFKKHIEDKHVCIGIDWAKDSSMNRGDVIERDGNVVHVRFKTVSV